MQTLFQCPSKYKKQFFPMPWKVTSLLLEKAQILIIFTVDTFAKMGYKYGRCKSDP
jgi:hypothetical protein